MLSQYSLLNEFVVHKISNEINLFNFRLQITIIIGRNTDKYLYRKIEYVVLCFDVLLCCNGMPVRHWNRPTTGVHENWSFDTLVTRSFRFPRRAERWGQTFSTTFPVVNRFQCNSMLRIQNSKYYLLSLLYLAREGVPYATIRLHAKRSD